MASGGAAGSAKGEGRVYCMRDGKEFKIGCSEDPDERLKEIQKQSNRKETKLWFSVIATEMNGAETAAQEQAQNKLGFVKIERSPTDWFRNPKRKSLTEIREVITKAVYDHNAEQKKK